MGRVDDMGEMRRYNKRILHGHIYIWKRKRWVARYDRRIKSVLKKVMRGAIKCK